MSEEPTTRLERLRRLAAAQPDDPFVHYGVGLECVQQGAWDEAIAAFDRAIALDPDHHPALGQKGQTLIRMGCPDEAAACLEEAIAAAQRANEPHAADELRKLLDTLAAG
jgi:uncharacterized protein HemY